MQKGKDEKVQNDEARGVGMERVQRKKRKSEIGKFQKKTKGDYRSSDQFIQHIVNARCCQSTNCCSDHTAARLKARDMAGNKHISIFKHVTKWKS